MAKKIDLRSWQLVSVLKDMTPTKARLLAQSKSDSTYEYVVIPKIFADESKGYEMWGRLKKPVYATAL